MTKKYLRNGQIATLKDGSEWLVVLDAQNDFDYGNDFLVYKYNWISLNSYNEDLTHTKWDRYNIDKIESLPHPYTVQDLDFWRDKRIVLWERDSRKEMTISEIEKALGYQIKLVLEE